MNNFVILLIIMVFVQSCSLDKIENTNEASTITDRINEDLNTPIEKSSLAGHDRTDLPQTVYRSDKAHSSISFRTKHWEIVDLIGWFSEFDIVMYADRPDFTDAVIIAEVNPLSLNMPNIKMAESAIQSPYIDSKAFPKITFESDSLKLIWTDKYSLRGKLSMNGITKKVDFIAHFNGFAYPGEKSICGFYVRGEINRRDFGIMVEDKLHSGKLIHDENIILELSIRME